MEGIIEGFTDISGIQGDLCSDGHVPHTFLRIPNLVRVTSCSSSIGSEPIHPRNLDPFPWFSPNTIPGRHCVCVCVHVCMCVCVGTFWVWNGKGAYMELNKNLTLGFLFLKGFLSPLKGLSQLPNFSIGLSCCQCLWASFFASLSPSLTFPTPKFQEMSQGRRGLIAGWVLWTVSVIWIHFIHECSMNTYISLSGPVVKKHHWTGRIY